MLTVDTARDALRQAGMRITPQRLMVIDVLIGNRTHPTVEDIYARVRARYPAISLATVYHTVSMLAQHGLVLELRGGKDGLRCDPDTTPHAHAYCKECGKVIDLSLTDTPRWEQKQLLGFVPQETEISVYGRCADCQSAV